MTERDGNAAAWMRLHVEALFTMTPQGRLLRVNEDGGAPAPRFFLGRTPDRNQWWVRDDVDPTLGGELSRTCATLRVGLDGRARSEDEARIVPILARVEAVTRRWAGPAFVVPEEPAGATDAVRVTADNVAVLSPYMEPWREDVFAGAPMVAALEGGRAVSVCVSVRVTPDAHEAGVETHPDFRGHGYGAQTVIAWARTVRGMGCVPLYSTSWSNEASRGLARKLGLVHFGSDLHIT